MSFLNNILSIDIQNIIGGLTAFSWILSGLFIVGIILSAIGLYGVLIGRGTKRHNHFIQPHPPISKKSPNQDRWEVIEQMFKSPDHNAWRIAIIDADSMLEDLVTQMGYQGSSFGEKLKSMQHAGIPWLQAGWEVHLLRNKLAHEGSRYPLNERESYRAYRIYENILVNSGYLA